jgi:hypothetical protein
MRRRKNQAPKVLNLHPPLDIAGQVYDPIMLLTQISINTFPFFFRATPSF